MQRSQGLCREKKVGVLDVGLLPCSATPIRVLGVFPLKSSILLPITPHRLSMCTPALADMMADDLSDTESLNGKYRILRKHATDHASLVHIRALLEDCIGVSQSLGCRVPEGNAHLPLSFACVT